MYLRSCVQLLPQLIGWPFLGLAVLVRARSRFLPWPFELLDTFLPYSLAPLPSLGLLALRTGSASLAALAGAGTAMAIVSARSGMGASRRPAATTGPRLRVLTVNVLAGNREAEATADLIERAQPDVVALQEVRPWFGDLLAGRIGSRYPYQQIDLDRRFSGAALFSRWPMEAGESFRLMDQGHICQRARLRLDDLDLHVVNVHLETPFEIYRRHLRFPPMGIRQRSGTLRDEQIEQLIELAGGLEGPTLVVGDFNAAAGSRPHRQLLRYFRDAFAEVGSGLGDTFPQPMADRKHLLVFPRLRIDYGLFKGSLEPISARTVPQPGSDHRALLVEFTIPGG